MDLTNDINKGRTSGDGMEQEKNTTKENQKVVQEESSSKCITKLQGKQTELKNVNLGSQDNNSNNSKGRKKNVSSNTNNTANSPLPGLHTLYRRPENSRRSLKPVIPKGELVPLKPRLVTQQTNTLLPEHKLKPPKFVPYEPYPGAVNHIVPPLSKTGITDAKLSNNKNNLDIGVLVSQMSTMRTKEMITTETVDAVVNESVYNDNVQKMNDYEMKVKKLTDERNYYQSQLKFQTQVNQELKNLLVASVGEDLQTHVNVLTEDKLQLARALLDTANNLTTHTEQIEFLAGQCEVWRSKFLASSVMVEELARWKVDLTHKNQMLHEATINLLQHMHQLRDNHFEILRNLKFLAKIRYLNLPATDVMSLSAENLNILHQIVLHTAGVGIPEENFNISSASTSKLCDAEKSAMQALEFVNQPLLATDETIRALFGQTQRTYVNNVASAASNQQQLQKDAS